MIVLCTDKSSKVL